MKIKVGIKFRACEGPAKGQYFTVYKIDDVFVYYKSDKTGIRYMYRKDDFGKFLERQNSYWTEKNKQYKIKKDKMRKEYET